jgi:excisionase family DNA binding protein
VKIQRASFYRVEDVARIMQAHPATVRRWIDAGELDAWYTHHGTGGGWRIDHEALARYVKARYGPYVKLDLPE